LQEVNKSINESVHSAIGMPPANVTRYNAPTLFDYLEQKRSKQSRKTNSNLHVGDIVRVALAADKPIKFGKNYQAKWTRDLYQIIQIHHGSKVPTFTVYDSIGQPLDRRYYENELNLVIPFTDDISDDDDDDDDDDDNEQNE
jgi:hypothetical protein